LVEIRLVNLTKRFGTIVAVDSLNLDIKDKEFITLLGPSGCGKTTTLRMIAGLENPTSGEIYMDNELINPLTPAERDIAMVFQNYALYPFMNVYQNIALPLKIRKLPQAEIDRRVKQVAEMLRIKELLDRKPKQLSGGEAQRVALARAIVREPKAFLLDEPLSNIDAKLRVLARSEIKALQKRLQITTIYVTHDQAEALSMSDRIAVMNAGKIEQVGSPEEIYSNPQTAFVAGFVGSPPTNLINCTLVEAKDGIYFDAGSIKFKVDDIGEVVKEQSKATELIIGVRPEHVLVNNPDVKDWVEMEVLIVESLGRENLVTLSVGEVSLKAFIPVDLQLSMGEKVRVSLNWNKTHIYEAKSGKLIV